jgi:hypothetical protein
MLLMITSKKRKQNSNRPTDRPTGRPEYRPAGRLGVYKRLFICFYAYSSGADTAAGIFLIKFRFANKDALAGRIPKRSKRVG